MAEPNWGAINETLRDRSIIGPGLPGTGTEITQPNEGESCGKFLITVLRHGLEHFDRLLEESGLAFSGLTKVDEDRRTYEYSWGADDVLPPDASILEQTE